MVAATRDALERAWHNPSSVHRAGQEARRLVELARADVAALIGAKPRSITFTSGGTEAIDLAIRGTLAARGKPVLVTTPVEHAAVRELAAELERRGEVSVRWLPVDRAGRVDVARLREFITPEVGLVSVQWANNETGVTQPLEAVRSRCRDAGVALHTDATQWVGKMPTDVGESTGAEPPADLLTFAPHKFHGPKGVGVLWARPGVRFRPEAIGTQEQGRRGGTENVPGIAGAGAAARLAMAFLADASAREALAALRDRFERAVLAAVPGSVVNGSEPRLWSVTNLAFPRLEAEAILLALSERGVLASAGAACSSGSLEPSPVLLAMGVEPALAHGSVRFSLGRETTGEELDRAAGIVIDCVRRVGASMPA